MFGPEHPATVLVADSSKRTLNRDIGTGALVLHHEEDTGRTRLDDIALVVAKRAIETFTIVEGDPASARADMVRIVAAERRDWTPRTGDATLGDMRRRNLPDQRDTRGVRGRREDP